MSIYDESSIYNQGAQGGNGGGTAELKTILNQSISGTGQLADVDLSLYKWIRITLSVFFQTNGNVRLWFNDNQIFDYQNVWHKDDGIAGNDNDGATFRGDIPIALDISGAAGDLQCVHSITEFSTLKSSDGSKPHVIANSQMLHKDNSNSRINMMTNFTAFENPNLDDAQIAYTDVQADSFIMIQGVLK